MGETRIRGQAIGDGTVNHLDLEFATTPAINPILSTTSFVVWDAANNLVKISTLGVLEAYFNTKYALSEHTHTFASLTSKPTTLSGYGITDSLSSTSSHYIGTTLIANNRVKAAQTLTGVSINGNAATANTFATPRTINGLTFNGSANISLPLLYDTNYKRITNPGGAEFSSAGGSVGAIEITLPVGAVNSMVRMTVKIYEYTTNESFEVECGGYMYTGNTWVNSSFAYIKGNPNINRNFSIRFGFNALGKGVIYIGELNSVWEYPQVFVTDVQVGYVGQSITWTTEWSIALQPTAFENITYTIVNPQIGYQSSLNTANSVILRDASGNFNAGTITASLNGNATTATNIGWSGITSKPTTLAGYGITDASLNTHNHDSNYLPMSYTDFNMDVNFGDKNLLLGRNISGWGSGTKPAGTHNGFGIFHVTTHTGGYATQFGFDSNQNKMWVRSRNPSTWTDWKNMWTSDDFANNSTNWNTAFGWGNHAGLYPTYNGMGATGNWYINIYGNASTATSAPLLSSLGNYVWTAAMTPDTFQTGITNSFVSGNEGFQHYGSVMTVKSYGFGGGGALQMYTPYDPSMGGTGLQVRFGNYAGGAGNTWTSWKTLLASDNFNNYAPTLTGSGASGTWNINITGTSSNTNSISNSLGNIHTWTNTNQFMGNGNTSTTNGAGLTILSSGGNGAQMSFHRAGFYAINMGVDSDNIFRIGGWSAAANRLQMDMSGNLTMAGDVIAYSDARVKTNIKTIEKPIDKIKKLRGVTYNRTDSNDISEKIGVIAQEIKQILPQVVHEQKDGILGVSYGNIVALLIEGMKAQQLEIDDLKRIINNKN